MVNNVSIYIIVAVVLMVLTVLAIMWYCVRRQCKLVAATSALNRTERINMSEIPEAHVTDIYTGTTRSLHDRPQVSAQPTEISPMADAPPPYRVAIQQKRPSEVFSDVEPQENSEEPPGYDEAVLQGAVIV